MTLSAPALRNDDFTAMRQAMVASQLRTTAVTDPRVVTAMAEVPRERFVPAHAVSVAYMDRPIDLGQGRALNVPLATARLLVQARLLPTDRVLLIGAAGGYAAAVLASLVAEVVAVEALPALAAHAREAMAGTPNVTVIEGPLEHGHPEGAPYDVLIVDGAIEELPSTLAGQVKDGGRIVSGVIERGVFRLASGTHRGAATALTPFADIDSVRLPGFARPRGFTF
ncbi:protein-L-isoaspartate(D-aspartate) O-methyltransferase [Sphingomonas sp. BE138]|uniref:protein-L-isoaspartate O-methyltransferase family protein n=1 Tax=Sphingomonas sp. BE138 TaxID=2817845 RepID=UPI002867AA3B|nr:protein-L-isoaspartate O-methyltransferase [Sphingomonas sp. BE138]MDR6789631.1 protein-L-isoaspartate(D-aspartate) O-methyltransferase [Sphingomonas sp. BE138]